MFVQIYSEPSHAKCSSSIALNDDQYIVLPSPPSAFHSPLYGPVLRFDSAFQVQGDASGTAAGDGEWRSLGWSAHLLSACLLLVSAWRAKNPSPQINASAPENAPTFCIMLDHSLCLYYTKRLSRLDRNSQQRHYLDSEAGTKYRESMK